MSTEHRDDVVTTAAMGLLAYISADIAHHALGHAVACLATGGSVISLSSTLVNCSTPGAIFAIAGPMANLLVGFLGLLVARSVVHASRSPARLFWVLVAGFNLLWFAGQLIFSIATRTDDWYWGMRSFHVGDPVRFGIIALGVFMYLLTIRVIASELAAYAHPRARAGRIMLTAWLAAGVTACAMAAFDHNVVVAFRQALPQSLALSMGLLFVPRLAARWKGSGEPAPVLAFSISWAAAAVIVLVASVLLLGPGIAIMM